MPPIEYSHQGNEPLKIIAILGISYSGSTLLNMMLDSHPDIYGGGEMHILVRKDQYGTGCNCCGNDCPVWTSDRIKRISKNDFYRFISDVTEKNIIADSGKSSQWFTESMAFPSSLPLTFFPVILTKHPIRHITSILLNNGFSKDSAQKDKKNAMNDGSARKQLFDEVINDRLIPEYSGMFRFIKSTFNNQTYWIKYEQLVQDPGSALELLLKGLKLDYVKSIENCYGVMHHQLGGNSGTVYQQRKVSTHIDTLGTLYSRWYKKTKGIALDDKYRSFLTEDEIRWLNMHEGIKRINNVFSYGNMPV